jgi:GH25 family lysozyme M1 (1,4-beta-N-acetylmuramidase)
MSKPIKTGIDVSYANGKIDWSKVKAAGIQFAIIRCGFGSDLTSQDDTQFASNVAGCTANGIPYGIYLYSYATQATGTTSIASEIKHAKRLIKGKKPFCVYIDMEDEKIRPLGRATLTKFAIRFCDAIKNAGYKAGVYANLDWFKNLLNGPTIFKQGYSIWVAQYAKNCDYTATDYDMWQYTSKGKCSGISKNVDKNYMYHDITK